jgi:hypothetical protein
VLDAVAVTAGTWRNRREVIQTSVLDARPEKRSWRCRVRATGRGVLVDWVLLAAGGGVALLVTFVAWGESNRRAVVAADRSDPDDDLGRERRAAGSTFALHTPASSTAVSLGAWLAVAVVGVLTGGFTYAYYYLRLGAASWPLDGSGPDAFGGPALAAVLVVAGLFGATTIEHGWVRSLLAWLALAVAAVVQLVSLAASGVSISSDAYARPW